MITVISDISDLPFYLDFKLAGNSPIYNYNNQLNSKWVSAHGKQVIAF